MSSPLCEALKNKYNVNALPIVKGDKVKIIRGTYKGKEGRVTAVYRKKWIIQIEGLKTDRMNGSSVEIGVDASKVEITDLKLSKDRKALLERKKEGKNEKYTEKEMATLD